MNAQHSQEHIVKEALKKIVDDSPNYSEKIKKDLKLIVDLSQTPEEIAQRTLTYFAAIRWK